MCVCDRERERAEAAKEAAVAAAKEALVHAVELQALEQVVALGEEAVQRLYLILSFAYSCFSLALLLL